MQQIFVDPPRVEMSGRRTQFRLLVDGKLPDGRTVDLTHTARYQCANADIATVSPSGEVEAVTNGATAVQVQAAGKTVSIPVTVTGMDQPPAPSFENDIVPLLSRYGCNSSGCHGKAEGQNGFKLSVFGFDPQADYDALTKEGRGRRVFPAAPQRSLLLTKVSGELPHGGGVRIAAGSREYRLLQAWIAAGLPRGEASDPRVESIAISPSERLLGFGASQQLRVVARYSDGQEVDVTTLARFQSNHDGLATVDDRGLVATGNTPGQVAVMASFMGAVDVFESLIPRAEAVAAADLPEHNFIDRHVYDKLSRLNIAPSGPASDAEFLRRVYLDTIGTLPTAKEARTFLTDEHPQRRARLVDKLLLRPEFSDYWALWWSDLLRVDRRILGHKGAYAYYRWIRDSLSEGKPLDRFARELLTAQGPLVEAPAGYFYQVEKRPGDLASTLSQALLGVRIACAECHHHPFDRWSQTDYYGMAGYFASLRRKTSSQGDMLVAGAARQLKHPRTGDSVPPHGLAASPPEELLLTDPRQELADWLTAGDNPWFARNLANRLWAHFLGRGLVEPVDDFRDTNPPTNRALLDALAEHLVASEFDLRQLIRTITASQTYQLTSRPNESNLRDEQNYSRALFKRLPAEVLLDAVCQTTGVPEKFDGLPSGYRAIELWDSQVKHYFLKIFGRPQRVSACECERSTEASIAQVLHLMNSPEVQSKLSHAGGRLASLQRQIESNEHLTEELYLTFCSRFPTPDERARAVEYLNNSPAGRRAAAEDLAWSLLNTLEFVFNH